MRHIYSLIRFVPDPARGEFVNVGALVGCEDSSEWGIRQISNVRRARALEPSVSLDAVWSFIERVGKDIYTYQESLESLLEAGIELNEAWLKNLYIEHRNIVQLSPPAPMLADCVDEALDQLFDLMILDPTRQHYRYRWKNTILAAARKAYKAQSIRQSDLFERVELSTDHYTDRFDFAVTNGTTLQLVRAWSFEVVDLSQLANQIKSWGWTVRAARDGGGTISSRDGRTFDVGDDVDIEVVYVPPADDRSETAFREGKSVFDDLDVHSVPLENVNSVAERARELLVGAGTKLDV